MQTGLAGVKLTMRDHVEAKTTKLSSVSATSVYASIGVERMFKSLSISVDLLSAKAIEVIDTENIVTAVSIIACSLGFLS